MSATGWVSTLVTLSAEERVARGWPPVAPFGPDAPRTGWRRWYMCHYCGTWGDMAGLDEQGQPHPEDCTPERVEDRLGLERQTAYWDQVRAEAAARADAAVLASGAGIQEELFA